MHLANRTAHSELSAEKAEALQGFLLDTMRRAWVDGYFRDWPETRKVGIANDFLRKLNDAELEYSRCKGLVSREHMFTANTLMQAFARNVTELLGHENMNPEVFMTVMEHTVSAFTSMHLEEKVRGAGAAL